MGPGSIGLMEFDDEDCLLRILPNKAPLHFIVANLNAGKDTVVILKGLQSCFPLPENSVQVRTPLLGLRCSAYSFFIYNL